MPLQDVSARRVPSTATLSKLNYIAEMLEELARMAPADAGPTLPYLIGMARTEAGDAIGKLVCGNHAADLAEA